MIGETMHALALVALVASGPTVILSEHVSLPDVLSGERPAVRQLVAEAQIALVNSRTRSDRYAARRIDRDAFLVAAAAGRRLSARPLQEPVRVGGRLVYSTGPLHEEYGALARYLASAGYRVVAEWTGEGAMEDAEPDPGLLAMGPNGEAAAAPSGDGPSLRILSVPTDRLDRTVAEALGQHRRSGEALFLLTMPPRGAAWDSERTALFVRWGGGPGLMSSPTTRRPGLIRVTDVAPTLLASLGVEPPLTMEGRAARATSAPGGEHLERLAQLQRRAMRAELGRGAVFDALMGTAIAAAILALALWPFGHRGAAALVARGAFFGLLIAPAVLAVAPLLTDSAAPWLVVRVSLASAGLSGLAIAFLLPPRTGLLLSLATTPLVLIADQLLGAHAAAFSYLGYSLQRDSRLYGIGNSMAVLTIVSALLLVGALTEAWPRARRAWWLLLVVPAAAIGAPQLGANTGGLLTATFALALAAGLAAHSPRKRWALFLLSPLIAGAAVAGAGLYDVWTHPDPTTHLGHAFKQVLSGEGEWVRRTMEGKADLVKERFSTPLWWGSVGAAALFLPFVAADSPPPTAGAPPLRYVMAGAATALFAGLVNDSGIVMTAMGCLPCIAGAALIHRRVPRRVEPRHG